MQARWIIGLSATAALLSACSTAGGGGGGPAPAPTPQAAAPAPRPGPSAFSTADFAWSRAAGKGAISGQLTYKVGAVAYSCANAPVVLTPETPWVKSRMMVLYRSDSAAAEPADEVRGRTPPERSQDYSAFVKRTTCDATGRFGFVGLPDGAWFVITVARPPPGVAGREMALMRRVVIRGGQTVGVKL